LAEAEPKTEAAYVADWSLREACLTNNHQSRLYLFLSCEPKMHNKCQMEKKKGFTCSCLVQIQARFEFESKDTQQTHF
jgi:REP element-mobilizing transposase RayT